MAQTHGRHASNSRARNQATDHLKPLIAAEISFVPGQEGHAPFLAHLAAEIPVLSKFAESGNHPLNITG
jgi:hypothetical protein